MYDHADYETVVNYIYMLTRAVIVYADDSQSHASAKPDVFDTVITLKQGQDHQTYYESVDHKQGHDHTKFERLYINCVQL